MSVETQVALITAVSGILAVLVPLSVQHFRINGYRISEEQERLILGAVSEGAKYAEEVARRETMTGPEKLSLASQHAQKVLAQAGVRRESAQLTPRVEAHVSDVRKSRLSFPPELKE